MGISDVRRKVALAAAAMAVTGAACLPGASASGDATVEVTGLALPAGSRLQVTALGCTGLFPASAESPAPMVGLGPVSAPLGKRSLGLDPAGGTAFGPVGYADAITAVTATGMSVFAEAGSQGVAYAGYQPPSDAGTSLMWVGRATVTAPAGQWSPVDATGLTYTWTRYDMSARRAVAAGTTPSTVAGFAASHGGEGYGFYAVGFGCDGAPFNTDAWRVGSPGATTTYDFEGYAVHLTGGTATTIAPGGLARLTAHVDAGPPLPARVVLERQDDDGDWVKVWEGAGTDVAHRVSPAATTTYRWKVYNTGMVDGDQTAPFTVTVDAGAAPAPTGTSTKKPAAQHSTPPTPATPASSPAHPDAGAPVETPAAAPSAPAAKPSSAPATPSAPAAPSTSAAADAGPTDGTTSGAAPSTD